MLLMERGEVEEEKGRKMENRMTLENMNRRSETQANLM